ncbi:MAG: DUF2065 family protein [Pseudomonadota bacterium]
MGWVLLGLGLLLVVEGLVLALAPSRIEDVLELLRRLPVDVRRLIGLTAVSVGVILVWIARMAGVG